MLPKPIQLRDMQPALCSFFKQSFPRKIAKVKVYDKIYDDFGDYFLQEVIGEEIKVEVLFQDNITDPYFYDILDRQSLKYTIEDELEWEDAKDKGDTCLKFAEWMKSKTCYKISSDDL